MADSLIRDLTALTSFAGTESIPIDDGTAVTKRGTLSDVRAFMRPISLIRLNANYTLANSSAEQKLFNDPTNGRITLAAGVYRFQCLFSISGMSATSGNAAFDILGAGTATLADVLYHAVGADGNTATAATQSGSTVIQGQSPASVVTAGVGTSLNANLSGTFELASGGTIIPSVTLVTAIAAVVRSGSYFLCEYLGPANITSIGSVD